MLPLDVRKTGEALVGNERLWFGEREIRRDQDYYPLPVLKWQAALGTLNLGAADGDFDPDGIASLLRVLDGVDVEQPGRVGLDRPELLQRVFLRVRH